MVLSEVAVAVDLVVVVMMEKVTSVSSDDA